MINKVRLTLFTLRITLNKPKNRICPSNLNKPNKPIVPGLSTG
jgi:hypothetical protein